MPPTLTSYIALLRGINVGRRTVRMEALRGAFEKMGHRGVRTVLASGNVLFESNQKDAAALTGELESGLAGAFGIEIPVVLRSIPQLAELEASQPFKGVKVTTSTRLYVTFLRDPWEGKLPTVPKHDGFRIVRTTPTEICSVLTLSEKLGSVDIMALLEKAYGKNVTTRNWNTVGRILKIS